MVLKIAALVALVICGLFLGNTAASPEGLLDRPASLDLLTAFGIALVPVIFSYGGWQTATFVAGEIKEPRKNLPRGLILGVIGVVVLYVAANVVYLRVLGVSGLAGSSAPASDAMGSVLGNFGARAIATAIAISTVGFLSQSMLTAPRVYFAQGDYGAILDYVVSVDVIFFGLTACCVFVFRRRLGGNQTEGATRVPGHPVTTIVFIAVCWLVAINTVYQNPRNTMIGVAIMLAGIPAYRSSK
jgi:APA family basic amino acid/polyamine antiporter